MSPEELEDLGRRIDAKHKESSWWYDVTDALGMTRKEDSAPYHLSKKELPEKIWELRDDRDFAEERVREFEAAVGKAIDAFDLDDQSVFTSEQRAAIKALKAVLPEELRK